MSTVLAFQAKKRNFIEEKVPISSVRCAVVGFRYYDLERIYAAQDQNSRLYVTTVGYLNITKCNSIFRIKTNYPGYA